VNPNTNPNTNPTPNPTANTNINPNLRVQPHVDSEVVVVMVCGVVMVCVCARPPESTKILLWHPGGVTRSK